MKKYSPILLSLIICVKAWALSFYSVEYSVLEGDDFASIIKKFVKPDAVINSKSQMIHKIRSENPAITEWRNLKPGQKFTMFISDDVIDMKKFELFKKRLADKELSDKKRELEEATRKKSQALRPTGYRASAFYMASSGSFNQDSTSTGVDIDFSQNSPLTLGLSALYYPKLKPYSFSSSVYYSSLSASVSNLAQEVDVPAEIGINTYMQHDLYKYKFSYYGGLDYETFSTFNTGLLASSNTIKVDENKVLYFTAGLSKVIKIGSVPIFSKISFSKSLSTSTSSAAGGFASTKEYSGYKLMTYFNYKFHKRWFTHTLIKYHSMSGPDDLSVLRYGFGFGYILK